MLSAEERPKVEHHPQLDLEAWLKRLPYETFETVNYGDEIRRRVPSGQIISSPNDLCCVEGIRRRVRQKHDLGKSVPVDLFVWSDEPPKQPYLTKLGGIPHREADKPWPTSPEGVPYTFVAQFCFLDSTDITPKTPGEVLLVFFRYAKSHWNRTPGDVVIEWSSSILTNPLKRGDMPTPAFTVPELSGVLVRYQEYPGTGTLFHELGHGEPWLLETTQATKIGPETHFIQGRPEWDEQPKPRLLCTLSALHMRYRFDPHNRWPLVNRESLSKEEISQNPISDWGRYRMMFADSGCMYFFIDSEGKIEVFGDCY
ncbi:MAG: DUF1963 domain-containing protein [Planctomycetaceae bacterium]